MQQDPRLVQHALALGYPEAHVYASGNEELMRLIAHAQAEDAVHSANAAGAHEGGIINNHADVFEEIAREQDLDPQQLAATQILLDQAPPRPVMPSEGGMKPLDVQTLFKHDDGLEQLGELVGTEAARGDHLLATVKQFAINTQDMEAMRCYSDEERRDIAGYVQSQMMHIEALHEWLSSCREQLKRIITIREQGRFPMDHPRAQKMAARLRSMKTLDVALEQMIAKFASHRG